MSEALKQFEEELQSKNFKGYWQNQQGDVARQPVASFDACHWKGKDLFAAMEKAGEVVGLDVSFRRVIQLWNPALKNGTSRTLVLNLQLLKPGENALIAPPYGRRHPVYLERPWHPADRRRANPSRSAKAISSPRRAGPGTIMRTTART